MARVLGLVTVLLVLIVSLLAWLWAHTLDHFLLPPPPDGPPHPRGDVAPYPGDKMENIWWFAQVSDIHISRFREPERTIDFKHFCRENIDILKPEIVLVTGDLTDAKTEENLGSIQYEVEWQAYKNALDHAHITDKTVWIDVRGNHDAFGVPRLDHKLNYYRKYSVLGATGDQTFRYQHKLPFGTYSFVSVYAVLNPGPRRPFNFFGILQEPELQKLEGYTQETSRSNHTVFFGHYPTSTIITSHTRLTNALKNGIAYLCGHLHSLGSKVPHMNVIQKSGLLELELEDWKHNRMYRVMAFDHDLLSFVDVKFGSWPVILITNPKRARFMSHRHEPLHKMKHSTHVRFLVYSPDDIVSATVEIDGKPLGSAQHVKGPLYVIPWDPSEYSTQLHSIRVTATDAAGRIHSEEYRFSLDGSQPEQWLFPAFFLMTHLPYMFWRLYMCLMAVFILVLFAVRWVALRNNVHYRIGIAQTLCGLASGQTYFYWLLIIGIYPLVGPWFVCMATCEHLGVYTLYGFMLRGEFIGETFSYAISFLNMAFFQVPVTIYFALQLNRIQQNMPGRGGNSNSYNASSVSNGSDEARNGSATAEESSLSQHRHIRPLGVFRSFIAYYCLLSANLWMVWECTNLYFCYGALTFFLSPKSSWTYAVVIWLLYRLHWVDLCQGREAKGHRS